MWLFAITLFVSAWLLFSLQPMVAKIVLPLLGGTPAVWNTCMLFFQAVLLAGYAYAALASRWSVRTSVRVHLGLSLCVLEKARTDPKSANCQEMSRFGGSVWMRLRSLGELSSG